MCHSEKELIAEEEELYLDSASPVPGEKLEYSEGADRCSNTGGSLQCSFPFISVSWVKKETKLLAL